jgi:glycerophosphoryl diester phosphodiesterase
MRNWIILGITGLLFGFTLFQASWIAPKPTGTPKLIAAKPTEPMRDDTGCVSYVAAGYGGADTGPDISTLAMAVGNEADVVHITTAATNGTLTVAPQFQPKCARDNARANGSIAAATNAISKPVLLWRVKGAEQAAQLASALPAAKDADTQALIGDAAAVAAFKKARPSAWAFSIPAARACASDYRLSGLWGRIPDSCKQGTMLLTVDELGYTLWGWPNRFLARTGAAGVKVVVAERVEGDAITGLTDVTRYGDIAQGFNGYIWIDKIDELGPALRR